jgi:hypothetical protein
LRLIAGGWFVLREKYCWLVADNQDEETKHQAACRLVIFLSNQINMPNNPIKILSPLV